MAVPNDSPPAISARSKKKKQWDTGAASSRSRFLDRSAWLDKGEEAAATAPPAGFEYSLLHRSVFVYGPMMADETQAMLLQPGNRNLHKRPGKVAGFGRFALKEAGALPGALASGPLVRCDGLLLERLQPTEMRAIDAFMNKSFDRIVVKVEVENGFGGQEEIDALMYVCPSQDMLNTEAPWNYVEFREKHLTPFLQQVVKPCREQFERDEKAAAAGGALPPTPEEPVDELVHAAGSLELK